MKVTVVLTTINEKTQTSIPELEDKCSKLGWNLIVVGDKRTPFMHMKWGRFVSAEEQEDLGFGLTKILPWNCYARKNIGYLLAYQDGADYVLSTDDDNFPYNNFGEIAEKLNVTSGAYIPGGTDQFLNYLEYFNPTDEVIWPRGLPYEDVYNTNVQHTSKYDTKIDVVAGLWDGSPDFDAIGHIYYDNLDWNFKQGLHLLKNKGYSPYNTQNTLISRKVLPYHFLPVGIGRADDIWTSYIAQFVLKDMGVLYTSPTVFQARNPHDYMTDIVHEKKVYLETKKMIKTLAHAHKDKDPRKYYFNCCLALCINKLIPVNNCEYISAWLFDLERIDNNE